MSTNAARPFPRSDLFGHGVGRSRFGFATIVAVMLLLAQALAGAAAATLEALPGAAPPQAEVVIRGNGYVVGAPVELFMVSAGGGPVADLGSFDANRTGALVAYLPIPDLAAADYVIEARDAGNILLASVSFEVLGAPSLSLIPASGPPGTVVSVESGVLPVGSVEIRYDGVPVLGPLAHPGGAFVHEFLVPADRPVPLGTEVEVEAIARVGGSVAAVALASFDSEESGPPRLRMISASGPDEPVRAGESFTVSGQFAFPANTQPDDYDFTLVWVTASGTLLPANPQPVSVLPDGSFVAVGVVPSIASGFPLADWGTTDSWGFVYSNAQTGESGLIGVEPITYGVEDTQIITIRVTEADGVTPLPAAIVEVVSNAYLVPPNYDYETHGLPKAVPDETTPIWSSMYSGINQFQNAIAQLSNPFGCPITLSNGVTNAQGEFTFNVLPILNEFFDAVAYSNNQLDINTRFSGPGPATFSIKVGAIHLGHGLLRNNGVCTGQRFDFQYVYGQDLWKQASELGGEFDLPFDPDQALGVPLPVCISDGTLEADPYMPGLPSQEQFIDGEPVTMVTGLYGFPDVNGASFTVEQPPQLLQPHYSSVLGPLTDVELFFNGESQGPMVPQGDPCSGGVVYGIALPQLATMPAQTIDAEIRGMTGPQQRIRKLKIQVLPGPAWIGDQAQDFVSRSVIWRPDKVNMYATEPLREQNEASAQNVGYGIGDLHNDNMSGGSVFQTLFPGGSQRGRTGVADATVAGNDGTDTDDSSTGTSTPIGIDQLITIVDTGKIPLFRYAWGIPPIASATVGADIWFKAMYYYFGHVTNGSNEVLVDLTSAAVASAGLDLWFDLSVILDLVNLSAFALPQVNLGMPIVIEDNQLVAADSKPCFQFLLDVAYSVSVGWCPLCIKAGDDVNLVDEQKPNNCQIPGIGSVKLAAPPQPPATDRTAISFDRGGQAMVAWGDASGAITVQHLANGLPLQPVGLPANVGAMAPDVAFYDIDKAVLAWSQSALSEFDFLALGDDVFAAAAQQHLAYRLWDGNSWGPVQMLTAPGGGDGRVELAACHAQDPACPAGGEVLAVWVHDQAADIRQHDFRLHYAYFNGASWTAPAAVDPASTESDTNPTAVYANGQPVVAWVRNPGIVRGAGGAELALEQRVIAYRFLRQSGGVHVPASLPSAVGAPSLDAAPNGRLALAFSVATEPDAFIGSRRSLYAAIGGNCGNGLCTWLTTERKDSIGRRIFVERPRMLVSDDSIATVVFRHLGADFDLPGDAPGALLHSGELTKISFELESVAATDAIPLTVDGAVHWHLDAALDPLSNTLIATSVQQQVVSGPALKALDRPAKRAWGVQRHKLGGGAVALNVQALLPDFELLSVEPSTDWIAAGESIRLEIVLRNNGPVWNEPVELEVGAWWDGPPGLGALADTTVLPTPVTGSRTAVELEIALPAGFHEDELHQLHVVVNPQGQIAESEGGNNALIVPIGALPAPRNVAPVDATRSGLITLHWDAVNDPRVTGYRVYRINPDGSEIAVGSSDVAGFVDFSAFQYQDYRYCVTSHSARLMESPRSKCVNAKTFGDSLIFSDGMEDVSGS